jgi:hypothetical protein
MLRDLLMGPCAATGASGCGRPAYGFLRPILPGGGWGGGAEHPTRGAACRFTPASTRTALFMNGEKRAVAECCRTRRGLHGRHQPLFPSMDFAFVAGQALRTKSIASRRQVSRRHMPRAHRSRFVRSVSRPPHPTPPPHPARTFESFRAARAYGVRRSVRQVTGVSADGAYADIWRPSHHASHTGSCGRFRPDGRLQRHAPRRLASPLPRDSMRVRGARCRTS